MAKLGLLTKFASQPKVNTMIYMVVVSRTQGNKKAPSPRAAKETKRTRLSPALSDTIPPSGLETMPAMLKTEKARPAETRLSPKSSRRIRGSHAMKA